MRKLIILGATLSVLAIPTTSMAHSDTIIAAAIGGATAGAAIGHNIHEQEVVVREEAPLVRHIVRERPVYQRVYYVEEPGYWRHRKHHRHHHDDHD